MALGIYLYKIRTHLIEHIIDILNLQRFANTPGIRAGMKIKMNAEETVRNLKVARGLGHGRERCENHTGNSAEP